MELATDFLRTPDPNKNVKLPKVSKTSKPTLKSNYESILPRSLVESFCDISGTTLSKLASDGILNPKKYMQGKVEYTGYNVNDVKKVFSHKKKSFKNRDEAEVISIFSQKGGVGKSAMTQQMASLLSLTGKVLVIDIDPQGDSSVLFNIDQKFSDVVDEVEEELTIAHLMDWTLENSDEVLYEKHEPSQVIKNVSKNIDLIPGDLDLGEINYTLNKNKLMPRVTEDGNTHPADIHMVSEVIDQLKDKYDYILIDCPPNIESLTVSALYASNRILMPLEIEAKSLTVMRRNIHFLERLIDFEIGFGWDKVLVVPNKFKRETIKIKALLAIQERAIDYSNNFALSETVLPNSAIIDKLAECRAPVFTATSKYGNPLPQNSKAQIKTASEFTNIFWAIAHELLDLELTRLVFDTEPKGEQ